MKKVTVLTGLVLGISLLAIGISSCGSGDLEAQVTDLEGQVAALEADNELLKEIAGPLPASLDQYFPPAAPAPIYLIEMFALAGPFEGIGVDLGQGDIDGAMANYNAFKEQYTKMSEMVPEWKGKFPSEPVDALGEALTSGDPSKIGPAMGAVGGVCGACHELNMVKAYQKYHWQDFDNIEIRDPISGENLGWQEYMFALAGAFGGITNDLAQGQVDNAIANFEVFDARFDALGGSCFNCHTSERTYFVDASVQGMIDQVGQALLAPTPDPGAIGGIIGGIGNESCMKCHLVHIPSQNTKGKWEHYEDLFK